MEEEEEEEEDAAAAAAAEAAAEADGGGRRHGRSGSSSHPPHARARASTSDGGCPGQPSRYRMGPGGSPTTGSTCAARGLADPEQPGDRPGRGLKFTGRLRRTRIGGSRAAGKPRPRRPACRIPWRIPHGRAPMTGSAGAPRQQRGQESPASMAEEGGPCRSACPCRAPAGPLRSHQKTPAARPLLMQMRRTAPTRTHASTAWRRAAQGRARARRRRVRFASAVGARACLEAEEALEHEAELVQRRNRGRQLVRRSQGQQRLRPQPRL